jgi:hypothetical protein
MGVIPPRLGVIFQLKSLLVKVYSRLDRYRPLIPPLLGVLPPLLGVLPPLLGVLPPLLGVLPPLLGVLPPRSGVIFQFVSIRLEVYLRIFVDIHRLIYPKWGSFHPV